MIYLRRVRRVTKMERIRKSKIGKDLKMRLVLEYIKTTTTKLQLVQCILTKGTKEYLKYMKT